MKKIINITLTLLTVTAIGTVSYIGLKQLSPQLFSADTTSNTSVKTETNTISDDESTIIQESEPEKVSRLTYQDHIERGDAFKEKKFYSLALKEYANASKLNSQKAEPYSKIGHLYLLKSNFEKANENFQIALEKEPKNNEIAVFIAQTLIGQKKFAEAEKTLNQIENPSQLSKYYQALLAIHNNNHELGQQLLTESLTLGTNPEIASNIQKYQQSYQEFAKFSGGVETHLKTLIAQSYNQTGEYALANDILYQVLRELPKYRDAWIQLGYSFLQQENYLDAKNSFEEALRIDPADATTHYFLGLSYLGLGNLEKATSNLEIALENQFKPQSHAKQKLAEIYVLNGDYENAAKYYEDISQNPEATTENYIRLFWLNIDILNNLEHALELGEEVVKKFPNDAMSYNLRGWAYLANNEFSSARKDFDKALEIDPNLDAAYLNLGLYFERQNDLKQAKLNYKKAYKLGKGNSVGSLAAKHYNDLLESENKSQPQTTIKATAE